MPNEIDDLAQGQVAEPQVAPEPQTLAEAFGMLRKNDEQPAEDAMVGPTADIAAPPAEPDQVAGGYEHEPAIGGEPDLGDTQVDDGLSNFDPDPARRNLMQQANAIAQQVTRQMFEEQGVRLMDIQDIYEKDERNGAVIFRNPDNPNRPFESRYEAQQYIDSINKQINARYQKELRANQQKAVQAMAPQFALLEYAPVYAAMSSDEKEIFDAIIEPYAINDKRGNVIGFNVNLAAAGNQAKVLAQKFAKINAVKNEETPKPAATTPALDMPQASGKSDDDEPKTLEEAFMKLNKSKKGK